LQVRIPYLVKLNSFGQELMATNSIMIKTFSCLCQTHRTGLCEDV